MDDFESRISIEVDMEELDIPMIDEQINYAIIDNEDNSHMGDAFVTDQVFSSREELLAWARSVAFQLGFVIVIMRSDTHTGQKGRRTYVLLGCERAGQYRAYKKDGGGTFTGTRKCGCPFRLKGKPVYNGEGWKLFVICNSHNHPLANSMEGHPYAGRLNVKEKTMLSDMTKSLVKPKNILLTLKENNEKNVTTIKQVYNARYAYRSKSRGSCTELQYLMKLLERDMYIHWHRVREEEDVVRDVFWAHPEACKLLNAFHFVLVIDSTYKTNRYRLPLLEIVGMTPTGMTFSVAFAFMECERVNNMVWVLQRLRGLILRDDALPNVIVTDKDLALMAAVKTVFPNSVNLLCRFHIQKNVKARIKMYVEPKDVWDTVMDAWGSLIDCPSVDEFDERLGRFEIICASWPIFVDYVKDTWVEHHKEKFVKAWTDQVMHFGNTTTNRVETAHSTLKRLLQNNIGDLCNAWDAVNNMITLQHTEIKASFERSIHVIHHNFNVTLYQRLRGMVSKYALSLIADEFDRVKFVGVDKSRCGCVLRRTFGLPCACELGRYVAGCIPLGTIHMFWRRLSFSDDSVSELKICVKQEMDDILKRFDEVDISGKVTIKEKLREIAYPDRTSVCAPPDKVATKGGKKKKLSKFDKSTKHEPSFFERVDAFHSAYDSTSAKNSPSLKKLIARKASRLPYFNQFNPSIAQFIEDIIDVQPDGHCGYRVIAACLGLGEDSWPLVRVNLIKEMTEWRDEYILLVGGEERYEELKQSLFVDSVAEAPVTKWMNITEMGYVIASRYNVILVSLSLQQCMTFFPLRTPPARDSSFHRLFCIGHVNGNHFVQVKLKDGSPIPPPALLWSYHCHPPARDWLTAYISRMQEYSQLIVSTNETVNLADD